MFIFELDIINCPNLDFCNNFTGPDFQNTSNELLDIRR